MVNEGLGHFLLVTHAFDCDVQHFNGQSRCWTRRSNTYASHLILRKAHFAILIFGVKPRMTLVLETEGTLRHNENQTLTD